jgi:hypothetical protein
VEGPRGHGQAVALRDRSPGIIRYRWVTDDALTLPDIDETVSVVELLTAEAS